MLLRVLPETGLEKSRKHMISYLGNFVEYNAIFLQFLCFLKKVLKMKKI